MWCDDISNTGMGIGRLSRSDAVLMQEDSLKRKAGRFPPTEDVYDFIFFSFLFNLLIFAWCCLIFLILALISFFIAFLAFSVFSFFDFDMIISFIE